MGEYSWLTHLSSSVVVGGCFLLLLHCFCTYIITCSLCKSPLLLDISLHLTETPHNI